jgi:diamine N-acetyltransferase
MQHKLNSQIRKCHVSDVLQLQALAIKTYHETFAATNSDSLLKQYYEQSLNLEKLEAQLQNTNSEFYFITSGENEEVTGFLKLNIDDAQTDILDPNALEIEKIYILREFVGQGLGKKLINFSIERALQQKKVYLWLGVWEGNSSALEFYSKMGFEKFGEHGFNMGGEIQTDFLLKKTLK